MTPRYAASPRARATAGRALPRLAVCAVGLGVLAIARGGWPYYLAVLFIALAVPTRPAHWIRYVLSGVRESGPPDPELSGTGDWAVQLEEAGERRIEVLRTLRKTGLDFDSAKVKVTGAPILVARRRSEVSARRICEMIERSGGVASRSREGIQDDPA
jgi:hypothetical protein